MSVVRDCDKCVTETATATTPRRRRPSRNRPWTNLGGGGGGALSWFLTTTGCCIPITGFHEKGTDRFQLLGFVLKRLASLTQFARDRPTRPHFRSDWRLLRR